MFSAYLPPWKTALPATSVSAPDPPVMFSTAVRTSVSPAAAVTVAVPADTSVAVKPAAAVDAEVAVSEAPSTPGAASSSLPAKVRTKQSNRALYNK